MKRLTLLLGLFLFSLVFSGCLQQTVTVFVCPTGETVSDSNLCPKTIPDTTTTIKPPTTTTTTTTTLPPTTTTTTTTTLPPTITTTTTTTLPKITPPPKTIGPFYPLEILEQKFAPDYYGNYRVTGKAKNLNGKLGSVFIEVNFYDENMVVIDSSIDSMRNLGAGEVWEFEMRYISKEFKFPKYWKITKVSAYN